MRAQRQSHSGTRHLFGIGLAVLAMLVLALVQPVGAQRDYASCGHFETQEDAQTALDDNPDLATTLDSDGDGIACEGAFDEGESEKDADSDDNAIEGAEPGEVVALPATGAGTAVEQTQQGPLVAAFLTLLVLSMGAIGIRNRLQRTQA